LRKKKKTIVHFMISRLLSSAAQPNSWWVFDNNRKTCLAGALPLLKNCKRLSSKLIRKAGW
jgi:hypothetical protein